MSGFDLPPIPGYDRSFPRPQQPFRTPEGAAGPGFPPIGQEPIRRPEHDTARPFSGVLADSLDGVKGLQDDVRDKVRGLVLGEDVELHDVLIASNKSETAFNLLLEVRNKMVDAWEKLSRSSV